MSQRKMDACEAAQPVLTKEEIQHEITAFMEYFQEYRVKLRHAQSQSAVCIKWPDPIGVVATKRSNRKYGKRVIHAFGSDDSDGLDENKKAKGDHAINSGSSSDNDFEKENTDKLTTRRKVIADKDPDFIYVPVKRLKKNKLEAAASHSTVNISKKDGDVGSNSADDEIDVTLVNDDFLELDNVTELSDFGQVNDTMCDLGDTLPDILDTVSDDDTRDVVVAEVKKSNDKRKIFNRICEKIDKSSSDNSVSSDFVVGSPKPRRALKRKKVEPLVPISDYFISTKSSLNTTSPNKAGLSDSDTSVKSGGYIRNENSATKQQENESINTEDKNENKTKKTSSKSNSDLEFDTRPIIFNTPPSKKDGSFTLFSDNDDSFTLGLTPEREFSQVFDSPLVKQPEKPNRKRKLVPTVPEDVENQSDIKRRPLDDNNRNKPRNMRLTKRIPTKVTPQIIETVVLSDDDGSETETNDNNKVIEGGAMRRGDTGGDQIIPDNEDIQDMPSPEGNISEGVECPMCGDLYPTASIQGHAANCEGKLDELPEIEEQADAQEDAEDPLLVHVSTNKEKTRHDLAADGSSTE